MKTRHALLAAAIGLSMNAGAQAAEPAARPAVQLKAGALTGLRDGDLLTFKGIPYAKPPVGDLRWRPPEPAAPWAGARDASAFGPSCMQKTQGAMRVNSEPKSEDCLTVNVWTPAAGGSARLPVMVWIYGGGKQAGSSAYPRFDGRGLASQGVVFVSFNYRVGWFGWFAHPALTREARGGRLANYGTMDQTAALQWVKANIAAFGGDPRNVTIFGESAGAASVIELMASPLARGLFHKAVSQSANARVEPGTLAQAEANGVGLMAQLGVSTDDPAVLRDVPADQIVGLRRLDTMAGESPIVDGKVLLEAPAEAFAHGRQAKVPFIVGTNDLELPPAFTAGADGQGVLARLTLEPSARDQLRRLADPSEPFENQIASDVLFTEPARFLGERQAKVAPTYRYRFEVLPRKAPPLFRRAAHAFDVYYVLQTTGSDPSFDSPEDAGLAKQMGAYWLAFARSGDPNGAGRPKWSPASTGKILRFTRDGPVDGPDPREARLEAIAHAQSRGVPLLRTGAAFSPPTAR